MNKENRFEGLMGAVGKKKDARTSNPPTSASNNLNAQTSKAKSVNPDYTRTTIYLPKKMHKKLKAIALEEEKEMSQIVEELLQTWMESRDKS